MHAPICQEQEAGQLHASVLADVNVEQKFSLQLPDLLLGVRATLLPLSRRLCWRQGEEIEYEMEEREKKKGQRKQELHRCSKIKTVTKTSL